MTLPQHLLPLRFMHTAGQTSFGRSLIVTFSLLPAFTTHCRQSISIYSVLSKPTALNIFLNTGYTEKSGPKSFVLSWSLSALEINPKALYPWEFVNDTRHLSCPLLKEVVPHRIGIEYLEESISSCITLVLSADSLYEIWGEALIAGSHVHFGFGRCASWLAAVEPLRLNDWIRKYSLAPEGITSGEKQRGSPSSS